MMRIRPLTLTDGTEILVEVEQAEIRLPAAGDQAPANLPAGVEPTGIGERLDDAMALLRRSIGGLAQEVHASLAGAAPAEWTMEVSIGFKGEARPIPVIVTGSATGSVKITAKWKREG